MLGTGCSYLSFSTSATASVASSSVAIVCPASRPTCSRGSLRSPAVFGGPNPHESIPSGAPTQRTNAPRKGLVLDRFLVAVMGAGMCADGFVERILATPNL